MNLKWVVSDKWVVYHGRLMAAVFLLLSLCLVNPLFSPPPAHADAAGADDAWWDVAWPYRIPVTVAGNGVAEVAIDFTRAFDALGLNGALLDLRSVRVVPHTTTGPGEPVAYDETYSTLLDDAEDPQIGWHSSGVYWTVNDGDAVPDTTRASQGSGSVKAIVENRPDGYGYPGVELHIASGDTLTDWRPYEMFIYDVWPEVNASARDQAPDLYYFKLYDTTGCGHSSITQGGPPLALDQWNAASVSLKPFDTCATPDFDAITRMEFHTRDNETVHGNGGLWDDGDQLTLWFDNLRLVDQDGGGVIRWRAASDILTYYIYFDTLTHEGHPLPTLDRTLGDAEAEVTGIAGVPEAGGYYHQISGAMTGALDIWTAPSVEKVLKTMAVPVHSAPLRISAARGEFEPFQLVVRAPTSQDLDVLMSSFTLRSFDYAQDDKRSARYRTPYRPGAHALFDYTQDDERRVKGEVERAKDLSFRTDVRNLDPSTTLRMTNSDGVIPAPTLHRVDYVNITTLGDHFDRLGWWPDPLWPLENGATVTFPAQENQPLWFTVHVPWDAEAGIYEGVITVGSAAIPVELEVWDFSLPREIHLHSEWGFGWSSVVEIYGGTRDGDVQSCYWDVVDAFKQAFIDHRLIPKGVAWPAGLNYPGGVEYDCDTGILDPDAWREWDFATLGGKYIHGEQDFNGGYGFPVFLSHGPKSNWPPDSLPYTFCGVSRDGVLGSQAFQDHWKQYLSAVDAYITAQGYDNAAYYHIVNEPQTFDDYDIVGQISALTEDAAPALRQLISEQVEEDIYTYPGAKIDIWMPTISSYEPIKSHDRQKNYGEAVWWYYLYGDDPPLPNPILMSHPGIEARITPWLAWAERVDGLLHYSATDWSPNPWDTPNVTGQDNGDGFFFYPPRKDGGDLLPCDADVHRLVPSIRWENLRDGMEDYEYLWLLAEGKPQIDVSNDADVYVAQLVQSRTRFSHVPSDLAATRAAIAEALGGPAPADVPPKDLRLSGPSTGFINTDYVFTARVHSTATTPLSVTWAATGQTVVTRQVARTSDTMTLRWASEGAKAITVTVANVAGQVKGTHSITIGAGPCATASATLSGTLIYTDSQHNPTTVFIPAGSVTTETMFCYTNLSPITQPPPSGFGFMGHAFALQTFIHGVEQAPGDLHHPLTITITYSDQDLADKTETAESDLHLYYIAPGSAWLASIDAANTCYRQEHGGLGTPEDLERYYTRAPDENRLAVRVCHLTDFGLVAPQAAEFYIYLPLVLRTG